MERSITQTTFLKPPSEQLTRVAGYARVSSGKDAMLHSLAAQVSYYSDFIQRNRGWSYVGVYADEAKTGTKDSRDNFQRLLADCHTGKIDLIITKSISRFARNTVTLLETVRELKGLGIDVWFEEQNIHTMSADGELKARCAELLAELVCVRAQMRRQARREKAEAERNRAVLDTLLG